MNWKTLLWSFIPLSAFVLLLISFIPGVSGNFWQNLRLPELRFKQPTAQVASGFLQTNAAIQATNTITPTVYSTELQVPEVIDTLGWPSNSSGTVILTPGPTGEVTRTFIYVTLTPSKTPTVTPSKTKPSVTPSVTLTPTPSNTIETPVVTTEPPATGTTEPPPPGTTEPSTPATTEP